MDLSVDISKPSTNALWEIAFGRFNISKKGWRVVKRKKSGPYSHSVQKTVELFVVWRNELGAELSCGGRWDKDGFHIFTQPRNMSLQSLCDGGHAVLVGHGHYDRRDCDRARNMENADDLSSARTVCCRR